MHFAAETKVYGVEPIRRVPADSRPLINCGPLPIPPMRESFSSWEKNGRIYGGKKGIDKREHVSRGPELINLQNQRLTLQISFFSVFLSILTFERNILELERNIDLALVLSNQIRSYYI